MLRDLIKPLLEICIQHKGRVSCVDSVNMKVELSFRSIIFLHTHSHIYTVDLHTTWGGREGGEGEGIQSHPAAQGFVVMQELAGCPNS